MGGGGGLNGISSCCTVRNFHHQSWPSSDFSNLPEMKHVIKVIYFVYLCILFIVFMH